MPSFVSDSANVDFRRHIKLRRLALAARNLDGLFHALRDLVKWLFCSLPRPADQQKNLIETSAANKCDKHRGGADGDVAHGQIDLGSETGEFELDLGSKTGKFELDLGSETGEFELDLGSETGEFELDLVFEAGDCDSHIGFGGHALARSLIHRFVPAAETLAF
jgi:hypothetical protein